MSASIYVHLSLFMTVAVLFQQYSNLEDHDPWMSHNACCLYGKPAKLYDNGRPMYKYLKHIHSHHLTSSAKLNTASTSNSKYVAQCLHQGSHSKGTVAVLSGGIQVSYLQEFKLHI